AHARGRCARLMARASRHRVDRLAVGVDGGGALRSVGGSYARILAVVRQCRAASVCQRRAPRAGTRCNATGTLDTRSVAGHAPAAWPVGAALVGVAWLAAPRAVPARVLGLVWFVPLFIAPASTIAPGAFRMTVLDVGQGLAVTIRTHAHALLYDTGPRYNDDA